MNRINEKSLLDTLLLFALSRELLWTPNSYTGLEVICTQDHILSQVEISIWNHLEASSTTKSLGLGVQCLSLGSVV